MLWGGEGSKPWAAQYIEAMLSPGPFAGAAGRLGWPRRCLLCSAWDHQALCAACLHVHGGPAVPSTRPRCPACGLRLALGVPRCAACERDPPKHGAVRVAVDYAHPWDRVLMQFKFGARPDCAAAMALLMAHTLQPHISPLERSGTGPLAHHPPTRLVPVPLSRERLAQRGYNQAWELARRLALRLGLKARADALTRSVHLAGQAEQDRAARLQRLRGVFQLSPQGRTWVAGQRVALVDDVLTTGATAAEAASALLAGGAAGVEVWAFARTPAPEEGPS